MSSSTSAMSSSCSKVASNSTLKPSSASRMRVAPSSFWSARNCESVFVSHHGYFLPVLKPSPTTRERRDRCSAALSPQRLPSRWQAARLHKSELARMAWIVLSYSRSPSSADISELHQGARCARSGTRKGTVRFYVPAARGQPERPWFIGAPAFLPLTASEAYL